MDDLIQAIVANYNYWIYITLMMIGLYAMIAKNNLVKKIVGMNIFQTAIILFYVSIGAKRGATIPILEHGPGGHGHDAGTHLFHAVDYINPLPHTLMLTAIVVGIATTALALALVVRIKEAYGTIEGDEITAMDNEMPF